VIVAYITLIVVPVPFV